MKAPSFRLLLSVSLSLVVMGILTTGASAQTCITNPGDGPDICVDWDEMDDPEFQTDFDVDFTDEYKPDVELRTGSDTWRVWSVQSGSPGRPWRSDMPVRRRFHCGCSQRFGRGRSVHRRVHRSRPDLCQQLLITGRVQVGRASERKPLRPEILGRIRRRSVGNDIHPWRPWR